MLDSEQLRVFLAILRFGNTLAAAKRLGVDHSTVSRRLTALERALGARLFDRSPRGLTPTEAAGALIGHAERIETELIAAASCVARADGEITGTVRLATPEVFGTSLVAPRMAEFRSRYPSLVLELAPESRFVSLSKREADIAIALKPPPRGRLVARKLADYRIGMYAARSYLAAHGPITDRAALSGHAFISYIDELLDYPELNALETALPGVATVFRSSSSSAQQAAVAAGAGLAMLHCIAAERDQRLTRILPDLVEVRRSYWLVMHADQQKMPRIRAVVDFLGELVDHMIDRS
ncbi:LysR family transcriptional regulator [Sphingobium algorifonticola]|uniref:LysR family transcriptional regulator n=1 Tax=Sphingobium algorifonticola TaxID=2008318 RepID=A0A437JC12_9SPHN|nr:LysR family transcriptional regulator [Sphingobium algorifonticola]RVT43447.1 LysR family transcriptional regulator [Sphingobium algorifonticola]